MPNTNCKFINKHLRRKYTGLFSEMKKLCKQEIQLTGENHGVFFKWHSSSPAHDIWKIEHHDSNEAYELVAKSLCILTHKQQTEFLTSETYLVGIYMPLYQSVLNWTSKENRRKAAISLVLQDLNKDDKRNFGERMRDLRKKNC